MAKQSKGGQFTLLPFHTKLQTRLGIATMFSFTDYKHNVVKLLKRLNKQTARYLDDNEDTLDGFWVIVRPVNPQPAYLGHKPGDFEVGKYCVGDVFPSRSGTKIVPLDYRIKTIGFHDY